MNRFPMYQVDAFTDRLFSGNPAAVVVHDGTLSTGVMQEIAAENNLSETAFVQPGPHGYQIRWFTPVTEVRLCGHATLAAAHVGSASLVAGLEPDMAAVARLPARGIIVTAAGDRVHIGGTAVTFLVGEITV